MRKVYLRVVDRNNTEASKAHIGTLIKGYSELDTKGSLSENTLAEVQACGDLLDYQRTLLDMVKRASNPQAGIGYDENEKIRGLVKKLKDAGVGGSLLLEEAEFQFLCEKVKAPYQTAYNEIFDSFMQSVLDSKSVTVSAVAGEEKAG